MTYTNTPAVVSQQTTSYSSGNIPYTSIALLENIPHSAQLEVERIFVVDRDGSAATLLAFLADTAVTTAQKKAVFIIPISRCTLNTTTKNISAINLPASGDVYNYVITTPTPTTYTIKVPILSSSTVTVRRKTVSNEPLVNWVAGSRLTSKQLNLATTQSLYLLQEAIEKIGTSLTLAATQITVVSLADAAVTPSKISTTTDPWSFYGTIQTVAPTANLHATTRLYALDKFFQHGVMTKDDVAPTSSAVDILETAATAGNSGLWFNPKNGTINLWAGNAWVTVAGTPVTTANLVSTNTVQTLTAAKTFAAGTVVPFTQTGTGAVARTVDAKLKDWTSIKDFGNNIQTAVTAIGASPTTLIIDANCTISSNLVIPTTMSVWIENGAIITVNSGITFTCNAAFLAYSNKVFDGSGTVVFGINSISVLLTEWFGAVADGTTDCTSAFTKAVAASTDDGTLLTGLGIIPIQLLTGNYVVGNIILPPACRLVGSGKWTTGLLCKVGTTGYWLTDNGSASKIILEDFSMYGQSNASITYGIRLGRNAYPHGTEAYMDGIHVRDLPSGWGIDVHGNVSSYDKINVWSCSNGIYLSGVVVAQNLVVYACTNTSIKTNLVSIFGLEIEAPATGGLPLDIEGNTSIDGLTISLANSTTISHVIEQRAAATAWSIQGLEYVFPAVPSGIVITNGNFKLADGTYVGGNATAANHDGEGNYSSKSFSINGQKIQCFKTRITNTAGTIQHRVDDTVNNLYRSTITNASTTLQNTPTGVDATTAFAFGGKIGSASPSLFTFNTSNQSGISPLLMASIAFNNTSTSYTIVPFLESKNINGVTITRPCLQLSDLSGVATSWSTALGTPGFIIDIQIMWFIA